jgi:hypothetical protein
MAHREEVIRNLKARLGPRPLTPAPPVCHHDEEGAERPLPPQRAERPCQVALLGGRDSGWVGRGGVAIGGMEACGSMPAPF